MVLSEVNHIHIYLLSVVVFVVRVHLLISPSMIKETPYKTTKNKGNKSVFIQESGLETVRAKRQMGLLTFPFYFPELMEFKTKLTSEEVSS